VKDLPNPFWAFLFACLGVVLLGIALLAANTAPLSVVMAVTTAGASLISGAFGYINGHKDGITSVSVPTQPGVSAATTVTTGGDAAPPATKGVL
jgi:hypothetical protein